MKVQSLCTLMLAIVLCFAAFATAQDQPNGPAVTNPPRYGNTSPAYRPPYPQASPVGNEALPPELVLPAGTLVVVRLTNTLSSDHNKAGDSFAAILDQPLVAQGWVVAQRGQTVVGQVADAQKAGRIQGVSQLAVELTQLVVVDGAQMPLRTELVQSSTGTSRGRDAAAIGATTGIGAVIGAVAGGGEGAAIGAGVGAAAGVAGVLSTRGRATELYPESVLTFRLQDPVTISTGQGPQAFRPVDRTDYNSNMADEPRNVPQSHPAEVYSPQPPPYYSSPYPYPYPYAYPYPYPSYGYYGYYGPTVLIGPHVYFHGHYYHGHHG